MRQGILGLGLATFLALTTGCGLVQVSSGNGAKEPASQASDTPKADGARDATPAAGADNARTRCEANYAPQYEALAKTRDLVHGKIDKALAEPNAHDQMRGLFKLRKELVDGSKELRQFNAPNLRTLGGRFRLEEEINKRYADKTLADAMRWLPPRNFDAKDTRPLLPQATEAALVCMKDRDAGALYSADEKKAAEDALAKSFSLPIPSEDKPVRPTELQQDWEFKAPFYAMDKAVVTSVTRDGKGGTIAYETVRDDLQVLGCSATSNRLKVENGAVRRDTNCDYGKVVFKNTVKLTFSDLPAFTIEKGDELDLLATVTEYTSKTKNAGTTRTIERTFNGNGLILIGVKRKGDKVWSVWE